MNIFPNGFSKGPYILIYFKGFLGANPVSGLGLTVGLKGLRRGGTFGL